MLKFSAFLLIRYFLCGVDTAAYVIALLDWSLDGAERGRGTKQFYNNFFIFACKTAQMRCVELEYLQLLKITI